MVFDLHNDLLTSYLSNSLKHDYIYKNHANIITLAYWTSRERQAFLTLHNYINEFSKYNNVKFAVEDIGFLKDEELSIFITLPLLYCTLVWKDENSIAGGHNTSIGLSMRGKRIVQELANAKIKIDTAHLSEKGFYEACEQTTEIFNSHCCLKSIHPHTRNISDDQVREIIRLNGIIGICVVDDFFGDTKGIDGYVKNIDTFVQKFGCDALAIGTDFFGTDPIKGLENYIDFENLAYKLKGLGYNDNDIKNIYYQNAIVYFGNRVGDDTNGKQCSL